MPQMRGPGRAGPGPPATQGPGVPASAAPGLWDSRPRPVQEVTSTEPTVAEMKEALWSLCCSRLTQSGSQVLTVSWGPARLSPPHCSDSPWPLPPLWLPCPPVSWESQGQAYPRAFSSPGKAPPPPRDSRGCSLSITFSGQYPGPHLENNTPTTSCTLTVPPLLSFPPKHWPGLPGHPSH